MQPARSPDDRTTITVTEARAARVVNRGAMLRVLVISVVLALVLMFVSYLLLS